MDTRAHGKQPAHLKFSSSSNVYAEKLISRRVEISISWGLQASIINIDKLFYGFWKKTVVLI